MDRTDAARKARALRAQADSTQFDEEAATYRAAFDRIVDRYDLTDDDLTPDDDDPFGLGDIFGTSRWTTSWWQELHDHENPNGKVQLFKVIEDAVDTAVARAEQIPDAKERLDYLEDLRKHVVNLTDGPHRTRSLGYDEENDKWRGYETDAAGNTINRPGIREARDRALADRFDWWCTWYLQNEAAQRGAEWGFRKDDDEWRDHVKARAEEGAALYGMRVSTVQAALRRVNGYKRFNTVLFPRKKPEDAK